MAKQFAIHPGDILFTEFMKPMGQTSYRVAKELGVPLPRVYDIVKGERSISADTAYIAEARCGVPESVAPGTECGDSSLRSE